MFRAIGLHQKKQTIAIGIFAGLDNLPNEYGGERLVGMACLGQRPAVKYSRYRKGMRQTAINADGIRLTKNLRLNAGPTPFLDGGTAQLKMRF